jgi:hypothetical protein
MRVFCFFAPGIRLQKEALAFLLARGRPANPAHKRFFFEKKNQKTFTRASP